MGELAVRRAGVPHALPGASLRDQPLGDRIRLADVLKPLNPDVRHHEREARGPARHVQRRSDLAAQLAPAVGEVFDRGGRRVELGWPPRSPELLDAVVEALGRTPCLAHVEPIADGETQFLPAIPLRGAASDTWAAAHP